MPEDRTQRTWIIVGLVAAAAAALYVFWRKSQSAAPAADTTTAGGVAPGYGTQLGDLIQFAPGDMSGQAGGPGGVAGGASGGQISPTITQGSAPSPILQGSRQAPPPRPDVRVQTGPGGVQSIPYHVIGRQSPAPQPAVRPAPTATQPRQTVSTVLRSGLRAGGGSGSSVSQAIGVLGMGSASPSRVANAPVAGSVPPRNLPAGVSVNNARRLGL